MRAVALVTDLIAASRIDAAARAAGAQLTRVDDPLQLPEPASVDLVLVDWAERRPGWGTALAGWRDAAPPGRAPALVLFGPHVDVEAHAEARRHGIGPVRARGSLFSKLPELLERGRRDPR